MKVAIVGATGVTGGSIVAGLLESDKHFDITALIRPSSIQKAAALDLKSKGINVVAADLQGPHDDLVAILKGVDVVISAIHYHSLNDEIPLATAAKASGVGRYVPCFFGTIAPRGVMELRDVKEGVLDHINRLYLPYTAIDVGWWYQIGIPRVPSGAFDDALVFPSNNVLAGGDIPSAMVDSSDIGKYVSAIISDTRTINKRVFAFTDVKTQNEIFSIVEKLSGEKPERTEISKSELEAKLVDLKGSASLNQEKAMYEYWNSWGARGDNTPEHATYLGYILAKDLYPSLTGRSLEGFVKDAITGRGKTD